LKQDLAEAVAESFFSNLKSEQIKKRIYQTRAEAKSEIFDYIEGFYNRVRLHKHLDQLSPLEFERKRQTALLNVSRDLGECQGLLGSRGLRLGASACVTSKRLMQTAVPIALRIAVGLMSVTRACIFAKSATMFVAAIISVNSSAYARCSNSFNRRFAVSCCAFKSALI
jgi:hypothetical protein